jgi:hypothetical protein
VRLEIVQQLVVVKIMSHQVVIQQLVVVFLTLLQLMVYLQLPVDVIIKLGVLLLP